MSISDLPVIWGVPEGYDALFLTNYIREHKGTHLHVARNDADMTRLADMLEFFDPTITIIRFPAWDCLPYDRVSPNEIVMAERALALTKLCGPLAETAIVVTTIAAIIQRIPPISIFREKFLTITERTSFDLSYFTEILLCYGYNRIETVRKIGEYAIRGGVIDLFPSGMKAPVRLDLFGNQIENIRVFDPTTQRSVERLDSFSICPITEVTFDKAAIQRFRAHWRNLFGPHATEDAFYVNISEGRKQAGMEHWLPLFQEIMSCLADYLDEPSVSFSSQIEEALNARLEMIYDHYQMRCKPVTNLATTYRPLRPESLYLSREEWSQWVSSLKGSVTFSPFIRPQSAVGVNAGGRQAPLFVANQPVPNKGGFLYQFHEQVKLWQKQSVSIVLAAWSKGSRDRLEALLKEHNIPVVVKDSWKSIVERTPSGVVSLIILGLERGFVTDRLVVLSEQDLLGKRIAKAPRRNKKSLSESFILAIGGMDKGDLVIHQEYGIGRYDGLETVSVAAAPHDCLRLIYDGGQKLFLPVENIELLKRYGSEKTSVSLDKLGGQSWQARKAVIQGRIRDIAAELIKTAAERSTKSAPIWIRPEGLWEEFCTGFPWIETDDQMQAISDVLSDLASGQPMDRLICGDVGFGKTEVALRAAFVAAMSGSQVAVIVPTTLLAKQHFRTFQERFSSLPIKIVQLSRLVPPSEAKHVRKSLLDGAANIVIGTHALLSRHVRFADLGLLIIDEEQHFGVAHKEKLKLLSKDVHVLTLSATPLPRTLQMSLTGIREISLIATPPVDRLAVSTFIMPFDSLIIREALQRERFRGGQIFCIVPRIDDLKKMERQLQDIMPDLRLATLHGRLSATELERVMSDFSDGKYDVLLSTNIVESGLDLPFVNTIIIYRADIFGLSQLYQLRGRIGRGKQRGYAYLTWPLDHNLSSLAKKRLEIMQTLDELGAGFTLAAHDLDIRGAGNLLGEEQSGHIREVGIELYQQMLEDAVRELRSGKEKGISSNNWMPQIVLGLPVLIPDTYVRDLAVRLNLYQRIGSLDSLDGIHAMRAELIDRFGSLPQPVENLMDVVWLKQLCKQCGVERLEVGPKGILFQFIDNNFSNPEGLINWINQEKTAIIRLRPDHKVVIQKELPHKLRLQTVKTFLGHLTSLAGQVVPDDNLQRK